LRWTNVDLKAKTVRTVENRVAVGAEIMSGIQSEHGTLPMPDEVVDVLRAARKGQTEERLACGSAYGSGEYVASGEFGQPSHPNLLTSRGGQDARRAGYRAGTAPRCAVYAHSQDDALRAAAGSFGRVDANS
jgi:hypothetical protein